MPLLVVMHGAGGAAENWQSYWARAEAQGMIVLAPDARSYTWDLVYAGFGRDVAFLDQALMHTFERCRVDRARIALGGFSDGASYALSLGVANGDLFSHLIAYSPGFYVPGRPITGEPRVFVSHGTSDSILPYSRTSTMLVPELEAAGYDVTFVSFDGDHGVPAAISETAIAWFLEE
jgi:phospholipase/carboxylesterase